MYQSYNSLQLTILNSLKDISYIIKNFKHPLLYIQSSNYQYLPIDDYSLKFLSNSLVNSIIPSISYIPYIYDFLSDRSLSISEYKGFIDNLQLEDNQNIYIKEVSISIINELIDKYIYDEEVHSFLLSNINTLYDSCYKPYKFNVNSTSKKTSFDLTINSYLELKGSFNKRFKYPLTNKGDLYIPNPYILILNNDISDIYNLIPILEKIKEKSNDLILIIDGDIDDITLDTLIKNNNRGILNIVMFKVKEEYEYIYDVSKVIRSRVLKDELELKRLKLGDLGICGAICISDTSLKITLNEHNNIPYMIHKKVLEKEGLSKRLERIGAISYIDITVGAYTDIERDMRYLYILSFLERLEDIRGDNNIIHLPLGLSSLSNHFFKSDIYKNIYIKKDKLINILNEIYISLNIFNNLSPYYIK